MEKGDELEICLVSCLWKWKLEWDLSFPSLLYSASQFKKLFFVHKSLAITCKLCSCVQRKEYWNVLFDSKYWKELFYYNIQIHP